MFYMDLRHEGLKKYRRISGSAEYVLKQRAQAQLDAWEEQWQRKCEVEQKRADRQKVANIFESKKVKAQQLTAEAQSEIENLKSTLASSLRKRNPFDWESLKRIDQIPAASPVMPPEKQLPVEPLQTDPKFAVTKDIWNWLIPGVRSRREEAAAQRYDAARSSWQAEMRELARTRDEALAEYETKLIDWKRMKTEFDRQKQLENEQIDQLKARYLAKDHDAVVDFVNFVLFNSEYPDSFPKEWQLDFISEAGMLIIDYELPALDAVPTLKAARYVQTRDAIDQTFLKDGEVAQLYDSVMYQTCLRCLHEVFLADEAEAVASITFNGWVNFIDKAVGKPARACIMSLQSTKAAFQQLNLEAVDPYKCFRALKGVGSSKLSGMAAVVPILRLNRNDERFVPAHDVINSVSEATNVAAIPWEEFEYLVRDIFEKEFSKNGEEVKITRASRDHGVDAVVFDPDPIRGGKIVIQAKRYTNVVGVSAVRDLYGTVINEGANRGILVTTSQYGPDSYDFAKDKPITLLDGGNLLSLLDKHGHRARIDLAEAKQLGVAREER